MSIGSPIVFGEASAGRQFTPLAAISTRRDDPNSFDEDLLQKLIDESPNVLPVREFAISRWAGTWPWALAMSIRRWASASPAPFPVSSLRIIQKSADTLSWPLIAWAKPDRQCSRL